MLISLIINRFSNKIFLANIALFTVLFGVSVGIRTDNLRYPLGRGHEYVTGHVLMTESIFEKGGVANYYFAPVWTYDQPAEKKAYFSTSGFTDKDTNSYYVSYPPLCFLAPYFCFKAVGVSPGVFPIRVFSLFVHFICSGLIFLIILSFFNKKLSEVIFLPALLASALYMFSSGNLWFHANVYFADMLEQIFAIGTIYLLVLAIKNEGKKFSTGFLLTAGIINFLGVYTEWLQIFLAFLIFLSAIILCFRDRKFIALSFIFGISTILSLSLTAWQYTSIAGFDNLLKVEMRKYEQRSGRSETSEKWARLSNDEAVLTFTKHYERQYKPILSLLCFSLLTALSTFVYRPDRWVRLRLSGHIYIPLIVLAGAIILHIIVFFNFNAIHDFGTLKASTLFCLIIGLSMGMLQSLVSTFPPLLRYCCIILFLVLSGYFISESVNLYYNNNNSNQITYLHANIGEAVKKYAKSDEVVFAPEATLVTMYFAERNIFQVPNYLEAKAFLVRTGYTKGIYMEADPLVPGLIKRVVRFNNKGDTISVVQNYLVK